MKALESTVARTASAANAKNDADRVIIVDEDPLLREVSGPADCLPFEALINDAGTALAVLTIAS